MKKSVLILATLLLTACSSSSSNDPQSIGKSSAPILIEEFVDLQCPGCAVASPALEQLARENDEVRLEYYHFPLSSHPYAFVAAEAAECAADQGKFWEFTDMVYDTQDSVNEDHLDKVAQALELDQDDFGTCLNERTYKEKVQAHMVEGTERGILGTPSIFVNGEAVQWTSVEGFEEYLEKLK